MPSINLAKTHQERNSVTRTYLAYVLSISTVMMLTAGWCMAQDTKLESRFSFEGEIEQILNAGWNYNLDENDKEDGLIFEPTVTLAMKYAISENTSGYLSLDYGRELDVAIEEGNRERSYRSTFEIDEGYVRFTDIFEIDNLIEKTSLTVGRFNLSDKREWLYDKSLDGILFSFELEAIDTQLGLSINREELIGSDLLRHDDDDSVNNYILVAEHEPFKDLDIEFTAYTIVRNDRSIENESPIFYGLSSNGKLADKRFTFWTDMAWARGDDDDEKIEGYGLDIGATLFLEKNIGTYVTLGYAYGSGDGDEDSDFRQTDLQGNSDKFGGVSSFKYYGELLDPELSNLHIYTAGIGYRFSRTASIDLVYHHYQQDQALDKLRSSDLDTDPDGENKEIGSELDVVLGFNISSNVETEIVLGYFQPGAAFDDDADSAVLVEAKLSYSF